MKPKTEGEAWKALKAKLKGEVREPNEAQKELCEGEAWTQSQNERSEIHCEVERQSWKLKAKPKTESEANTKLNAERRQVYPVNLTHMSQASFTWGQRWMFTFCQQQEVP